MEIKKVYKTSYGVFWDKVEAEKKVNRAKDHGSRPGDPVEYEPVQESYVLIHRPIFGSVKVFSLSEVEVK